MLLLNKNKFFNYSIIITILVISAIFHGVNMFRFPYYENDEGVYLSQAWSFLYQGKMAPYTYWYDHSPVGWLFTSFWIILSGGIFNFGFSLNSGRVFMFLLHLASTYFVYRITQRLTQSKLAGVIAVTFFSVSPLGIFFQRRLLLDNIMSFWVLLSYYLILGSKEKRRLIHFILSAIAFGIAILTKENAIFFAPGFLFALYFNTHDHHKRFAIIKWLVIVGLIVSTYFLYALLKGELFPAGSLLGGSKPHVSLIGTLQYQLSRKGGSPFDLQSSFWHSMFLWTRQDIIIIVLGFVCNIALSLIAIFKIKRHLNKARFTSQPIN